MKNVKDVKAVLFGIGYMGKLMATYMHEKNINIVAAFSRRSHVGEDLGTAAGLDRPIGVTISTTAEEFLSSNDIDIALVATSSDMESFVRIAELCVKNGINVVTIAEEAFYPWPFKPELTQSLNQAAEDNGVTVLSTGVQDVFWLNIPTALTAACQNIQSMHCTSRVNLDMYGEALASQYPLDLSREEYEAVANTAEEIIPFAGVALEALVDGLGLTTKSRSTENHAIYDSVDIVSESLGRTVKQGRTCGVKVVYSIETEEQIRFESEFIEKLCRDDENEMIAWQIRGTPDVGVTIDPVAGPEITCATAVNRILDVIAAAPGFIHAGRLPHPSFK